VYVLVALALVGFMFPLVWLFLTSIKPGSETFTYPPTFIFEPTLDSYSQVFGQSDFPVSCSTASSWGRSPRSWR